MDALYPFIHYLPLYVMGPGSGGKKKVTVALVGMKSMFSACAECSNNYVQL